MSSKNPHVIDPYVGPAGPVGPVAPVAPVGPVGPVGPADELGSAVVVIDDMPVMLASGKTSVTSLNERTLLFPETNPFILAMTSFDLPEVTDRTTTVVAPLPAFVVLKERLTDVVLVYSI